MIIGKVPQTEINIDSTLTDEITLHCKTQRCPVRACCYREAPITMEEKNAITTHPHFDDFVPSKKIRSNVRLTGIMDLKGNIKRVSTLNDRHDKCIFLKDQTICSLEKYDLKPTSCKIFPLLFQKNKISVMKGLKSCLFHGYKPAYEVLTDELDVILTPAQHTSLNIFLSDFIDHNP